MRVTCVCGAKRAISISQVFSLEGCRAALPSPVVGVQCFTETQWEVPPRTHSNNVQEDVFYRKASAVAHRQNILFELLLWNDEDWR